MIFVGKEFNDYLLGIADAVQGDDYRKFLKKNLKDNTEEEIDKIISGIERITSVLKGKGQREFIDNYLSKSKVREKIKRKYKGSLVSRKIAIEYTGQPPTSFDRLAHDYKKIEPDGKSGYYISDLDKILKLIIQMSKSALCINSHYMLDRKRNGFIPFNGGKYYKVVDETEKSVFIYNEKWEATIMIPKDVFKVNFRVEEEIDFSNHDSVSSV